MNRILGPLLLLGIGYYLYSSGILFNLMHDLQPEVGRKCEVVGPTANGLNLTYDKDDAKFMFETHIGNTSDKANSLRTMDSLIDQERAVFLPEHTKVKILGSDFITVYGCRYAVAHVKVASGPAAGADGWVERDNVMDSPLMTAFQSMRGTKRTKPVDLPAATPDAGELQMAVQMKAKANQRRMQQAEQAER